MSAVSITGSYVYWLLIDNHELHHAGIKDISLAVLIYEVLKFSLVEGIGGDIHA